MSQQNSRPFGEEYISSLITKFSNELIHLTNERDVAWLIVDHIIEGLNYEDGVVYLFDERRGRLVQTAAYGSKSNEKREIISPIQISPGEGIVGRVYEYCSAKIIKDTSMDSNYILDDRFRLSEIAVPIHYNEKVFGVIDSEHSQENFFTIQDQEILTTIARLVAEKLNVLNNPTDVTTSPQNVV